MQVDASAHGLDDAPGGGQAQARAPGFGGDVGPEDLVAFVVGDARARVDDVEADDGAAVGVLGALGAEDELAGRAGVHRLGGVEHEIQDGLLEVRGVDLAAERPDRLVFDLDPDSGVGFAGVRDAARDVRDLLQAADLKSFAMVTGGKGIHVVVPLDASQDWDEVKDFAKGVATRLAETEPKRFTATMSKAKRKGRIFIDWLRNERGSTAIAPYSTRAKPEASVATPVTWTELGRIPRADAFTVPDVVRRLTQKSDPWAGYFDVRQKIGAKALKFFAPE